MPLYIFIVLLMGLMSFESVAVYAMPDAQQKTSSLVFDPQELDLGDVVEGETIRATILIRNNGNAFAQITSIESSCGCTTAEPEVRMLETGSFTPLHIEIDTFGKHGDVRKSITMIDGEGVKTTAWLHLHVKNSSHALADKRSIFDAKCATCHASPAQGKVTGADIYKAVCVMCHGERAQGGYAPNLQHFKHLNELIALIGHGTGTHHMPAFAKQNAGPLTQKQISTLAKWIISLDE